MTLKELDPKEIAEKEIARQIDFGYEPGYEDMVIAGMEALKSLGYEQVWKYCPECKGVGRVKRYNDDTGRGSEIVSVGCSTCKGTGKVRIQFKLEGIEEKIAEHLHWHDWDCEVSMAYNYGSSGLWEEQDDYLHEYYIKEAKQILFLIRQDNGGSK